MLERGLPGRIWVVCAMPPAIRRCLACRFYSINPHSASLLLSLGLSLRQLLHLGSLNPLQVLSAGPAVYGLSAAHQTPAVAC